MTEKNSLAGAITSEDVLGKDVIDARGAFIGVSDKLYLHPKTMKILGISVDKGFLRTGLIISANYVTEVTQYAILLNIEPSFRIKGMTVFGSAGGRIGTVLSVSLVNNSNTVQELIVKTTNSNIGTVAIPAKYLAQIEDNAFLNITTDELIRIHTPATKVKR